MKHFGLENSLRHIVHHIMIQKGYIRSTDPGAIQMLIGYLKYIRSNDYEKPESKNYEKTVFV